MDLIKHRSSILYYAARARAKKKNLEFSITKEWVYNKLIEGRCQITNFILILTPVGTREEKRKSNPYAPSLDRKDSNLGYTVNNTQIVISAVNKFKSDMLQYEMIDIAKAIVHHHMSTRQFIVS